MSEPELYAVAGKPIAHSLSPDLFELFFQAFNRKAVYTRLAADSAEETLRTARAIGLRGLNVTSPFKEEIVPLLNEVDDDAAKIGAVNCVRLNGSGPARGYNTDFIGLIGTLKDSCFPPRGRRALVLGTGGAARAAAFGLLRAGAARVILAGRSIERARVAARCPRCRAARLDRIRKILCEVEVVISCLPFPATHVLPRPALNRVLVVDAHYSSTTATPEDENRRPSTALGWLFHQAVASYEIFTGLEVAKSVAQEIWTAFADRQPRRKPHLALVGFPGTGKTSVGRELARLLGREFIDSDDLVEEAAGQTIPEIFKKYGNRAFRSLEKAAIKNLLVAGGTPKVISAGGGAVLDEDNRAALADACRVVWLWASVRTALSRVEVGTRPVLDPDRPLESAQRILAARLPLYAEAADLVVSSESRSPLEIARRIKDEMDKAF